MFAKTHAGVIAKINEHFVKTGILSKDEGRTISILQNMRQYGDYDDCFEWSEEDVFPFFQTYRRVAFEDRVFIKYQIRLSLTI